MHLTSEGFAVGIRSLYRPIAKTLTVLVDGKSVNLSVGIAVSMEIKTGKCRVISYFLSPLLRYGSESLRER